MKKKLLATFIAFVSVVTVFAFAGCSEGKVTKTEIDEKTCYVFTASGSTMDINEDTTVADYLFALKEKGELNFEGETGAYGLFISSVDGLAEQYADDYSSGSYWSFYLDFTTLEGDDAIYALDSDICEYNGKTYYYANYGFSSVPCVEGHTYILAYVSYGG